MKTKVCSRCNTEKDVTEFYSYGGRCKLCVKERSKVYRENNKEKINSKTRGYRKHKRQSDSLYKVKENIRVSIINSFIRYGYTKNSRTFEVLGCTYVDFKLHIESNWEDWMNWDNYGIYNGKENYGWDLDHIIPVSSATCEENLIRLNHYTNLQPLCSYVNRFVKRDKIDYYENQKG